VLGCLEKGGRAATAASIEPTYPSLCIETVSR
jgi:hypothetical protein